MASTLEILVERAAGADLLDKGGVGGLVGGHAGHDQHRQPVLERPHHRAMAAMGDDHRGAAHQGVVIGGVQRDGVGRRRDMADLDASASGRDDMDGQVGERVERSLHLVDVSLLGTRRKAQHDERRPIVGGPGKVDRAGMPLHFERRPDVADLFGARWLRIAAVELPRLQRCRDDQVAVERQPAPRRQRIKARRLPGRVRPAAERAVVIDVPQEQGATHHDRRLRRPGGLREARGEHLVDEENVRLLGVDHLADLLLDRRRGEVAGHPPRAASLSDRGPPVHRRASFDGPKPRLRDPRDHFRPSGESHAMTALFERAGNAEARGRFPPPDQLSQRN